MEDKMKRMLKRNRVENNENLESYLQSVMQPVAPRPAFVSGLKTRLITASENKQANRQVFGYVLLTLLGVAFGALFLATGLRAVLSLAGALGLLKVARDHAQTRRTTMLQY
jgi:hypothetical protein